MKSYEKLFLRAVLLFVTLGTITTAFGQATNATAPTMAPDAAPDAVPRLVQFSGIASDVNGKPLTGTIGITFLLYSEEQGGAPLWLETQNVQANAKGHYSVELGATKPDGLPGDVFNSGAARWLGVQIAAQAEQPRVLLLSVPYALKAADAATIGGLPPSAFVRVNPDSAQAPAGESSAGSSSAGAVASHEAPTAGINQPQPQTLVGVRTISPGATVGFVPVWSGSKSPTTQIASSNFFQSGSNVGVRTTSPAATLDVNGTSAFRDTLTLFPNGSDPLFAVKTAQGTPISIVNGGNEIDGTFGDFQGTDGSAPLFTVNNTAATGLAANSEGTTGIGIEGSAGASSGKTTGILGLVNSPNGTGVLALGQGESQIGIRLVGCCAVGVWGDTSSIAGGAAGLVGTAGDARGIYLENNSPSGVPTAYMQQDAAGKLALVAGGGVNHFCTVDTTGSLVCNGSKSAAVPVDNGKRQVALYAVEAPQNWFEDFGSGQLSNGAAVVTLESTFAQTINTDSNYHVFLTPEGDCRGLYVSNKAATGFEVHELGTGQSNVTFSYRIVALRRGYENVRLEDKTEIFGEAGKGMPRATTPADRWTPPAPLKSRVRSFNSSGSVVAPARLAAASSIR